MGRSNWYNVVALLLIAGVLFMAALSLMAPYGIVEPWQLRTLAHIDGIAVGMLLMFSGLRLLNLLK